MAETKFGGIGGNLIWRMANINKFGGNLIWRIANIFKFGENLIWRMNKIKYNECRIFPQKCFFSKEIKLVYKSGTKE